MKKIIFPILFLFYGSSAIPEEINIRCQFSNDDTDFSMNYNASSKTGTFRYDYCTEMDDIDVKESLIGIECHLGGGAQKVFINIDRYTGKIDTQIINPNKNYNKNFGQCEKVGKKKF